MSQAAVSPVRVDRFRNGEWTADPDLVVREEPLEIRLGYGPLTDRRQRSVAVTMRTPGNDFELALGFLRSEGVIRQYADVSSVRYCTDGGTREVLENIVRVELSESVPVDFDRLQRHFYTTSSCGVCGKTSLEAVQAECPPGPGDAVHPFRIAVELLTKIPDAMRGTQTVFTHTGGLHAAALFDEGGRMTLLREDVGRHNALDKLIGARFASGEWPIGAHGLFLSGRACFELVQKAAVAGIPLIAAVGAPSDLAVSLAQSAGITLIGFLRENRFNIYSHPERIRA
jgi:FdhD protein